MHKTILILIVTMMPMCFIAIRAIATFLHQNVIVPTVVLAIIEVALVIAVFVVIAPGKPH